VLFAQTAALAGLDNTLQQAIHGMRLHELFNGIHMRVSDYSIQRKALGCSSPITAISPLQITSLSDLTEPQTNRQSCWELEDIMEDMGCGEIRSSGSEDSRTDNTQGLLPIFQWLGSMEQTQPPSRKLLTIERLQGWSMLAYYPLEHVCFLAAQKIITLKAQRLNRIAIWSCRFWAAYVILQFVHLKEDNRILRLREKSLKGAENVAEQREDISRRKRALWNEFLVNVGYLPLTIHWYVGTARSQRYWTESLNRSLEQGLYRSEVRAFAPVTTWLFICSMLLGYNRRIWIDRSHS
jgi:hypothetical protein